MRTSILLALLLNISAILAGLTAASLLALGLGALGAAAGGGPGSREADVAAGFAAALFIGVTITLGGFAAACASTAAGLAPPPALVAPGRAACSPS